MDVVDAKGLILSPGFPDNYSSGTHCVWQFFVPIGHQLMLEILDFDVFEGSARNFSTSADLFMSEDDEEHLLVKGLTRRLSEVKNQSTETTESGEDSNKMESESWNTAQNSMFPSSSEGKKDLLPPSSTPTAIMDEGSETLQLVMDVCPDDVLYITDLITFSSRFCGSKRPSEDQLVFGSDVEMVEVIMELITNTHWGRGFALIFHYQNRTTVAAVEVGGQRSSAPSVGAVEALLAAVSLAALLAASLVIVLCLALR